MSLHETLSIARSLARLAVDITVQLPLVLPATLFHALIAVFPHPALARLANQTSSLLPHSTHATTTAFLAQHTPPIALTPRYTAVHTRLLVTEELSIPAAASGQQQRSRPLHLFMVTGNPGTVHFYVRFLSRLYHLSGRTVHIHGLSFAGHQSRDALNAATSASATRQQQRSLYSLKDQTDLWVAYMREWLGQHKDEEPQVVMCGHSIGAWIALEVCDQLGGDRILHSFLLFPALSHMATTPAGKRLNYPLAFGRPLAVLVAWLLVTFIPESLRYLLARTVISAQTPHTPTSSTSHHLEVADTATTITALAHPHTIAQCIYLGHTELQTVVAERAAHDRLMAEGRATVVSGAADEWDPTWLQEERRRRIGGGLREVRMEAGVKHAFVIGSSDRVAEVVWNELQSLLNPPATDTHVSGSSRVVRQQLRH